MNRNPIRRSEVAAMAASNAHAATLALLEAWTTHANADVQRIARAELDRRNRIDAYYVSEHGEMI